MDNPKGRVSPGEGLVKMVRVLPVRPVGEVALLGVRGAVAPGGRAAEEESPGWH